jgi:predicted permease
MSLWQDARFAVRLLWKDRWFTAVAALALALGIGVNTAVFTIVNGILLRGLPFDRPDRIVSIGSNDARGRQLGVSKLDFVDWQASLHSYSSLSLFLGAPMNLTEEGPAPEQYNGTYIGAELFPLIGAQPMMGRTFLADDDRVGAQPVAIIGHTVWKNRYGSDRSILGRVIKVNSLLCTVIGVMGPDMRFPFNADVWLPFSQLPPEARDPKRDVRNTSVIGRLRDGVSLSQARSELETVAAAVNRDHPDTNKDIRAVVTNFSDRVVGPPLKLILYALSGAVAFVLLIACANVANLLLARSSSRTREIAVRSSLGATRGRIVRQLLVESLLLACTGGLIGLGLAVLGVRLFDAALSAPELGKPYWMTFTFDPVVFAYLAAICVATGLIFGLAPALHVSRTDVNEVLKESGGRSAAGGVRTRRWTGALVVTELVLTLVLLAGAGYMMRSFLTLYSADVGADTSQVLTLRLYLPLTKYPRPETRATLVQRLEDRLQGVPALQAFAITTNPPLFGGFTRQLSVQGRSDPSDHRPEVTMVATTSGFFETLGVRPLRGRTFERTDGTPGHEAAMVNQRFAAMHFGHDDPLGHQITLYDAAPSAQQSAPRTVTIVGIVPSIRQRGFQDPEPDPVVYLPFNADPQRFLTLMVRGNGDPGQLSSIVREEARAVEPDVPLFGIFTLDALLAQQRWPFRVFGSMFAGFALIALALSAVGLYAVTAYSVTQRTAEIGVRMAVGAEPLHIMWMVFKRALIHLAIGLPIGIAGAIAVGRVLQSVLVATGGREPLTIAAIALLMIAVSVAACFWPARRATRLDPVSALRYE